MLVSDGQLSAVYDITVAYPDNCPVKEVDLLAGHFPQQVHFHVKRYSIDELPTDEPALQVMGWKIGN